MNRRLLPVAIILLFCAMGAWLWAYRSTPMYKERAYSNMPLEQMAKEMKSHENDAVFLYYIGHKLNQEKRYEEAIPFLERSAGLDPDTARTRSDWADALIARGRVTDAFGQLSDFVRTHPNDAEGHIFLGQFYGSQNAMERAREELEKATSLAPQNGLAWKYLALSHEKLLEKTRAEAAAVRAISLIPEDAEPYALMGRLESQTQPQKAIENFRKAASLMPDEPAYQNAIGQLLLLSAKETEHSEGEQLLRNVAQKYPDDTTANRLLGQALVERGQSKEAIPLLLKANKKEAWQPMTARLLSNAYRKEGNLKESQSWQKEHEQRQQDAEEYRKLYNVLAADAKNVNAHRKIARLLAKRGAARDVLHHYAQAEQCALDSPKALVPAANDLAEFRFGYESLNLARLAKKHSSANPAVFEAMGNALLSLNRLWEAAVQYKLAMGWDAKKSPIYQQKLQSAYLEKQSHPTEADSLIAQAREMEASEVGPRRTSKKTFELVKKAIELEPENPEHLRYLFGLLVAQRRRDEALETGSRLLTLSPEDTYGHVKMAALLMDDEKNVVNLEAVEEHLRQAEGDVRLTPMVHYVKGLVAQRKGQWNEAVKELRIAIEMDPNSDIAFLRLSQAERAAGNTKEAEATAKEYERRREGKLAESDLLAAIAEQPNKKDLYEKAIAYYRSKGKPNEAGAILREMQRHFSTPK
jgi:tetratricopeptide (TPR) repeat protein